jgi:predicted nucleic acid-binding protein
MRYLLDAGTLCSLFRGSVMLQLRVRMSMPTELGVPAPALIELHAAVLRLKDRDRRDRMAADIDRVAAYLGVVPLSADAAAAAARMARHPAVTRGAVGQADLLNMAIARSTRTVLVSTRALALVRVGGVAVENWVSG